MPIVNGYEKPPEPFVRVGFLLFFFMMLLGGYMIGTGLGKGIEVSAWWYLLALAGLAVDVFGFRMRTLTRNMEMYEAVEDLIRDLRLSSEEGKLLHKVNREDRQ
jgi:hypothetical protein